MLFPQPYPIGYHTFPANARASALVYEYYPYIYKSQWLFPYKALLRPTSRLFWGGNYLSPQNIWGFCPLFSEEMLICTTSDHICPLISLWSHFYHFFMSSPVRLIWVTFSRIPKKLGSSPPFTREKIPFATFFWQFVHFDQFCRYSHHFTLRRSTKFETNCSNCL